MNVFIDSPLDALAFDYVRIGIFTFVNNLWTWVAVITAAVSFWRIRAAFPVTAVKPEQPRPVRIESQANEFSQPVVESVEASRLEPDNEPAPYTAPSPSRVVVAGLEEVNGVTKGKFFVYYQGEDRGCDDNGDVDGEVTEWDNSDGCEGWWETWERMSRVRKGETGWYRFQDLTVFNGNVVRLWDGVRRDGVGGLRWDYE